MTKPTETETQAPEAAREEQNVLEAITITPEEVCGLNIHQRMFRATEMISVLVKRDTNTFQKYRYVSHDDVVAKVRQAFKACGILAIMNCDRYELETYTTVDQYKKEKINMLAKISASMTFINPDSPEDRYTVNIPAYALDTSDKALGKAISYAKKYALIAMSGLMLATGDDQEQDAHEMQDLTGRRAAKLEAKAAEQEAKCAKQLAQGQQPSEGMSPSEVIAKYGPQDYKKLTGHNLIMLSDSYARLLGAQEPDWAYQHVQGKFPAPKTPPNKYLINLANKLEAIHTHYGILRNMAMEHCEKDPVKAKALLKQIITAHGWKPLYTVDPEAIAEVILEWRSNNGPTI